jgi:hypothetical protein
MQLEQMERGPTGLFVKGHAQIGGFVKGQSGNPNGRKPSPANAIVKACARKAAGHIIELLIEYATDKSNPPECRWEAIAKCLAYAFGEPSVSHLVQLELERLRNAPGATDNA